MEAVESVARRLGRIVNSSAQEYVNKICTEYLEDKDKDRINEHITRLSKLQKAIYRYQNEVYMLAGVGDKHDRAAKVVQDVCTIVRWVEELLCCAMVDYGDVKDRHVGKKFMYQLKQV